MVNQHPLLTLSGITRTFKTGTETVHVLNHVNLNLHAGERVAIVGQSGSGKSTLLQIAGLLDSATEGTVHLSGQNVTALSDRERSAMRNKLMGFVYQYHHLLPEFTALENVLMPHLIGGGTEKSGGERATALLHRVGLAHRLHHHPAALSGGEQQRVAIARALMNHPQLLLADEPTGNLDPHTAGIIADLFDELVREEQMTLLIVTHNEALAERCDTVYHMTEGHLAQRVVL